ncbi:ATP-binding protein [Burkholderia cenocepacia]|uniref:histidine kinase n=2 Tax=Burkholderia cenocepacia TaxID=95486 RepID=A0A1V2XB31_9BURK|nr:MULTISPECIES: ATP-binding protein [Burkholderia]KKI83555.1 histidine kinase [Burkholderia cenocepacia]KVF53669.1 histidine kinase [Burkholderia cenocepacia]MBG0867214.1 sensor histidine kinase N-terminal domain-containing protein [Burkholderia sp. 9779_493]MBJ9697759.1 sensor histidine kinase N-terminal domain-containing protein [Burkholderia cenocepacia]MBN3528202.1 sensor histidine kinase N-terminal domain-containing protein [Burkholderia cenocepacia]
MTRMERAVERWRNASLRRRLLTWLLPAACVIGLVASAGTYWGALRELDDLLDDQMRSMSKQIVVGPNGELSFSNHAKGKHGFEASDPDAVLLQVWRNGTLVYSTDRDSKLPPPAQQGIASVDVGGQPWRTYVTERGGTTIRLAQARHARWEAIAGIAVHLLWPVFSMLPLLALGLWFGIGAGLRPLRAIASGLKRRNANNLEPVDVASMPNEVRPLAEAINDLLARLDRSFTLQRHFIADAAHELRTPIMGLSIQSQLLRRAATAEEREHILAQIHAGTTRLGHLAEQLLTLARLEPDAQAVVSASAPVDLAALCRSVVSDRARVADAHRIDLGAIVDVPVMAAGNADTLRVLLNNLVDNAIRYAGEGARVDVSARVDGTTPVLEVADDGPGIPEAERADVWERFYRGEGAQAATSSGSGLGLSIVKRIAEQHRATVSLGTTRGGRGLTVTVRFPLPA